MKLKNYARLMMNAVIVASLCAFMLSCGGGGDDDSGSTPGKSGTISLATSVSSLPADNSSSCTITATIRDGSGDPVRHYTDVTFTTTLGRFRNGSTTYKVQTQPPLDSEGFPNPDASPTGMAQVALIAGLTSGSAKVTISSNGVTNSIYVTLTGVSGAIVLTASPTTLPADGSSSSIITATLTDSGGNPVTPGTPVSFKTGLGLFQDGGKTYSITTPDSTGVVKVSFQAGLVPGNTYIVAISENVSQRIGIVFTNADASKMSLDAEPRYIEANGTSTSLVTAMVTNLSGQPIKGVPVTYYLTNQVSSELPPNNTYTGSGERFTAPFYSNGGSTLFTINYAGTDYFSVWLWNYDTYTSMGMLYNATGAVSNQRAIEILEAGNYFLEFKWGEGNWSVMVDGDIGPARFSGGEVVLAIKNTDESGSSKYTYTSTKTPQIVAIRAETGEVSKSSEALSKTITITQTEGPPAPVNLTAQNSEINANGQTETTIDAFVLDGQGNIVPDGTVVTFSATTGTLSNISTTVTAQNTVTAGTVNGVASVKLTSVASAATIESTVTATVGANSSSVTVTFRGVSLTNMAATPAAIFANGTDKSTITVRLEDASGVAIVGETIVFSTTGGTITTAAATTNAEGVATTELVAPTTTGSATITATYGTITTTTTISFEASEVGSITLVASPTSIPADGASSSVVTATIKDSSGAAVTPGTSVTFGTDLGTFSGGGTTTTVVTSNDTGTVSVSLISATTAGSATVTATSNGVTQSVNVTFTGSVASSITVTANPNSLPADGTSTSIIRADVRDAQGNPVPDGESINFIVLTGTGTLSSTSALTVGGFAEVTYTASKTAGTETIRAMTGTNVSSTVDITLTGATIGSVQVTADPTSISADGQSTSTITATVKTADNQVVPDVEVIFTTSRGAITSPHTTDAAGKAVATLTSDQFNDPSVLVTATSQGVSGTVLVSFTGLSLTAKADPTSVLAGESATITATFKDASGNPINGATLTFSTDKGTLNPDTPQTTNASGQAAVALTSSTSGTATVTVTGGGATATTTVNFTRYFFTLEANPTTIRVTETSVITATLLDNGVAKAGETVYFSSTLGVLNPFQAITGVDGKAASTLTAGTQSGIAVIDGTVTIASDTPPTELAANTQVVITGGAAAKVIFTADPDVISTETGVATLTATVYDTNDQPVPDQEIYFRINKGPGGGEYLSASVKITNSFGVATVELYAGSLPSAYQGVEIEANTQVDFGGSLGLTTLTIAGPVANIGIGMDLHTLTPEGGDLTVDITAIATDVNGNPVSDGTVVSFSVQAVEFDEDRANDHVIDCWDANKNVLSPCPAVGTPGYGFTWFSDDVNQDGKMYGCTGVAPSCPHGPMSTTEDVNHNGILDPGEDKNDNGVIDPIQGTVIDGTVSTTSGLAKAKLVYPQPQANNIMVRVTAEAGGVSNFYETILLCTETMVEQGTCGIGY